MLGFRLGKTVAVINAILEVLPTRERPPRPWQAHAPAPMVAVAARANISSGRLLSGRVLRTGFQKTDTHLHIEQEARPPRG